MADFAEVERASFRDPSGFLFRRGGVLYRQINQAGSVGYEQLMRSGLGASLIEKGYLIPHKEVDVPPQSPDRSFRIIQPEVIPFVSYPYEWCFGAWRAAALRTLVIQRQALQFGMVLKDASAFNIQFFHGAPILIDTLSFLPYTEGQPWLAYRQFCQHFLGPIALMAKTDIRLGQLFRVHLDGIPLDLTSRLLPISARVNFGLGVHIFAHAAAQNTLSGRPIQSQRMSRMNKNALLGLVESLEDTVKGLSWDTSGSAWKGYYQENNYSLESLEQKAVIIEKYLDEVHPRMVWDLGANTGKFSELASRRQMDTIALESDPGSVETAFQNARLRKDHYFLPLLMDLTNPSAALGWGSQERMSLLARGPADMIFALALIHHLVISNNLPLPRVAEFLAQAGCWLAIEFVPKSDSQTQRLLASRDDIFDDYTQAGFESAFLEYFELIRSDPLPNTERTLYLLKRRS
jgi:ribosomal protein L11 methylase PrmA